MHLPLIMGKNEDGSVSKLSKRHGATSFDDLMADGYLPEADHQLYRAAGLVSKG